MKKRKRTSDMMPAGLSPLPSHIAAPLASTKIKTNEPYKETKHSQRNMELYYY